jgi:anti-anti-sigma factor
MASDDAPRHVTPRVRSEPFGPQGLVIEIDGDCDLACVPALEHALGAGIDDGHRHLVIDLTSATLLDCAAMGAVFSVLQPLRDEAEASVVLVGPQGIVARFLEILPIGELFAVYETREEAVSDVLQPAGPRHEGWRAISSERPDPLLAVLVRNRPNGSR